MEIAFVSDLAHSCLRWPGVLDGRSSRTRFAFRLSAIHLQAFGMNSARPAPRVRIMLILHKAACDATI